MAGPSVRGVWRSLYFHVAGIDLAGEIDSTNYLLTRGIDLAGNSKFKLAGDVDTRGIWRKIQNTQQATSNNKKPKPKQHASKGKGKGIRSKQQHRTPTIQYHDGAIFLSIQTSCRNGARATRYSDMGETETKSYASKFICSFLVSQHLPASASTRPRTAIRVRGVCHNIGTTDSSRIGCTVWNFSRSAQ